MATVAYPEWTGEDDAAAAWNTVVLGGVQLPGICSVDGLECSIDVDTKKAKGAERPTSTDNGVKPAKFEINVWMNTSHYAAWQVAIPQINPRRPGHERAPVQIVHPAPNELGIDNVRIISIAPKHPTSRGGRHVLIRVEEWFDKPVAVKKKEKPIEANADSLGTTHPELLLDAARRAALRTSQRDAQHDMHDEELDPNTGKPLSPSDTDNVKNSMFVGNPNAEGS